MAKAKAKKKAPAKKGRTPLKKQDADARNIANPQEYQEQICNLIAEGENLTAICERADMPSKGTVYKWLRESQTFSLMYGYATAARRNSYAEDVVKAARDIPKGADATEIMRVRVEVDALKWAASHTSTPLPVGGEAKSKADRKRELAKLLREARDRGMDLDQLIEELESE